MIIGWESLNKAVILIASFRMGNLFFLYCSILYVPRVSVTNSNSPVPSFN